MSLLSCDVYKRVSSDLHSDINKGTQEVPVRYRPMWDEVSCDIGGVVTGRVRRQSPSKWRALMGKGLHLCVSRVLNKSSSMNDTSCGWLRSWRMKQEIFILWNPCASHTNATSASSWCAWLNFHLGKPQANRGSTPLPRFHIGHSLTSPHRKVFLTSTGGGEKRFAHIDQRIFIL